MICNKVLCPHYKHEDSQVIYCEGVQDGITTHLAFASKTVALDYKKAYCRKDYKNCEVCRMLEKNNEIS